MADLKIDQVLLVDDEKIVTDSLTQSLQLEGFDVHSKSSAESGLKLVNSNWRGAIVTDLNMPGMDGLGFLKHIQEIDADIPVIVLTAFGNIPNVVAAMQSGAYDFLEKPFSTEYLIDTVKRALEKRRLTMENRRLLEEVISQSVPGPRILGNHAKMVELRYLLNRVKDAHTDILIHGETGTGKELVAQYLHYASNRRDGHFVPINCGAIARTLMESELFGHEVGAFTGADKKRIGKIEYANNGTLFLDEIESMPMDVQINLLRVLEERKLSRLGSNEEIDLDIRIVAATKENLLEKAEKGEFRLDLYYRLNIVEIEIPPLRERKEDILLLFDHFIWIAQTRFSSEDTPKLTVHQKEQLLSREFPGNVRELRNLAESFVLLGPERVFGNSLSGVDEELDGVTMTLVEQINSYESAIIRRALLSHHGRLKAVQNELGLARKTLYEKMKKHDLQKESFKNADNVNDE